MSRIVCAFLIGLFFTTIAFGQDSLAVVVAEKGDGIFSLLRKQGMDPINHYQDFLVLNKENLREGQHLYEGTSYLLPTTEDSIRSSEIETDLSKVVLSEEKGIRYPIFGEEEALGGQ